MFLADTPEIKVPNVKLVDKFGAARYARGAKFSGAFREAYPSMLISYVCVFGGAAEGPKCDEGVKVCTNRVEIPDSLPTFPPNSGDPPGCRWVRKTAFISFLDNLVEAKK